MFDNNYVLVTLFVANMCRHQQSPVMISLTEINCRTFEKEVWLHCDIKACDSRKYNCETVCPNDARKRRDVFTDIVKSRSARGVSEAPASGSGAYQPNILTVGPMRSAEYYDEVSQGKEEYKSDFLDSFLKPSDSSVDSTNDDSISDFFSNLMSMFDFDFFRSSEQ